jgi:hypothetical protein
MRMPGKWYRPAAQSTGEALPRARAGQPAQVLSARSRSLRAGAGLRSCTALLAVVVAAAGLLAAAGEAAPVQTSSRVAFYADLANFVSRSSPAVVRPGLLLLTEDGSVVVRRLRWRSWGGQLAHGSGTFSASNCVPSCATGNLTNHPADVTLSRPGVVLGHRVYRCVQLTVPSHRKSDQHDCLGRAGTLILYKPSGSKSKPKAVTEVEFYWAAGACSMGGPGPIAPGKPNVPARVLCQSLADVVSLLPGGRLGICRGGETSPNCLSGNAGQGTPRLAPGRHKTVGPFRCISARASITCVVTKTGRGFRMTASTVARVGR